MIVLLFIFVLGPVLVFATGFVSSGMNEVQAQKRKTPDTNGTGG